MSLNDSASPSGATDFRTLFESVPGLYLVLTPEFRIVAVSDAYLAATMTRRDDILGRGIFEVFPDNPEISNPTGVSNLRASLERVVASRKADSMAVQQYDIRKPEAEGGGFEKRFWSPVNSPVLALDGTLKSIIHRVEDVTAFVQLKEQRLQEHRENETLRNRAGQMEAEIYQRGQELQSANSQLRTTNGELKRLAVQLQDANQDLEAFNYSIAHDLRAPLRHISGFTSLLVENYARALPAEAQNMLGTIIQSTEKMSELVTDLLKLSHLGRQSLERQTVVTTELARRVLEDLKSEREKREVDVQLAELPECEADPSLLRQVFFNLLSNAFKYTRSRSRAVIQIGSRPGEKEPVFFVKDNGMGFDMRYAQKLFGVFHRLHNSKDYEGSGVGLAIVQRIIHRHGGQIAARAEIGRGAEFYFTLGNDRLSSALVAQP